MFNLFSTRQHTVRKWLLAALGLLIALSMLTTRQRLDAKEYFGATTPVWSPDGQSIVYVRQQEDKSDLYLFNVQSGESIQIAENAGMPSWSPDGKRIAYTGFDQGNETINILDVQSKQSTQLTIGFDPAWSPNGQYLTYMVAQTLEIAKADGTPPRHPLTDLNLPVWSFAWSPDSKQIALVTQGQTDNTTLLYIGDFDGSTLRNVRQIADDDDGATPAWSPDGKQLLFGGHCGDQSISICAVNPDGSGLRRLAAQGQYPSYSPDGKQIAFTLNGGICVINTDGTGQHCLTKQNSVENNDSGAIWSPDSRQLIFVRMHQNIVVRPGDPYFMYSGVYVMDSDGAHLKRLPDGLETF